MDMFEAALHIEPRLLQVRKLLRAAAVQKRKAHPPGKLAALKNAGALLKTAALLKKDPTQSLELAETLMRADPFNLKYAKALCDSAVAAELPEAAIQTLEILKEQQPNDLLVLEPLALLYHNSGLFRQEYECRNRIVRLKPNDSTALNQLKDAAAHNTMEKAGWDSAKSYRDVMQPTPVETKTDLETCLEKIKHEPENMNHYRTLAELYLRAKQFEKAIQTLETCQKKTSGSDPQFERSLIEARAGQVAHEIAQAEEAGDTAYASKLRKKREARRIEDAAEQVKHYPNDLQLKYEYGQLLFENGRHTEAIQQFQQAQRNPQRRVRSLFFLARSFREKGQLDIAMNQLETALGELETLDDTKKEVLYELGLLCEAMNHPERAEESFKKIYAVDIGYRDVAVKIEQTYNQSNRSNSNR